MPTGTPAERFEVRAPTGQTDTQGVAAVEPLCWHRTQDRAARCAERTDRTGAYVVWTHTDDTWLPTVLDNATQVWPPTETEPTG